MFVAIGNVPRRKLIYTNLLYICSNYKAKSISKTIIKTKYKLHQSLPKPFPYP